MKNQNLIGKVMLSLNPDMLDRARGLIPFRAKESLSGNATVSSVLRESIALGLDILEKDEANQG